MRLFLVRLARLSPKERQAEAMRFIRFQEDFYADVMR